MARDDLPRRPPVHGPAAAHPVPDFRVPRGGPPAGVRWGPLQQRFGIGAGAFFLKGWWGGVQPPPPPRPSSSGGADFSEAPKGIFGLKTIGVEGAEKFVDRPKARRKIWPNILKGGGYRGCVCDPPPPPGGAEVLKGALIDTRRRRALCALWAASTPSVAQGRDGGPLGRCLAPPHMSAAPSPRSVGGRGILHTISPPPPSSPQPLRTRPSGTAGVPKAVVPLHSRGSGIRVAVPRPPHLQEQHQVRNVDGNNACRCSNKGVALAGGQGCIRREGTAGVTPEAVRQAVGGGCQSGWGRLPSVTNAIEAGTWRQGDSGWAWAGRPGAGGGSPPPFLGGGWELPDAQATASSCTPRTVGGRARGPFALPSAIGRKEGRRRSIGLGLGGAPIPPVLPGWFAWQGASCADRARGSDAARPSGVLRGGVAVGSQPVQRPVGGGPILYAIVRCCRGGGCCGGKGDLIPSTRAGAGTAWQCLTHLPAHL